MTALGLVLAAANGWVFAAREDGFLFEPASGEALYGAIPAEVFAPSARVYAPADVEAGRRILLEGAGLLEGDSPEVRVEKVGAFLLARLDGRRGTSTAAFEARAPLAQYQGALRGEGEFWCTNFAETYVFFATLAGVPTRKVSVEGASVGHTFAESLLPGGWAVVDLQTHKLRVTEPSGAPVGAVELYDLLRAGRGGELRARVRAGGSQAVSRPLVGDLLHTERRQLAADAQLVYQLPARDRNSLAGKAYRWLLRPDFVYAQSPSLARQRVKQALFVGGLGVALCWLVLSGRWVLSRRRAR